ncbi:alpha-amylase family glycosyl hydrolase [Salinirubrum litoreum]|uniref:Alpha-amylase family glycosyl hydrolase n=1 Tax=Salinirubrum litoreum TaxID=1126234 RepID=A0ABD5R680_9EURY|nr:alpha-amylase family glycosyl hydrolase [Salinirubrum litoreum]
MHHPGPPRFTSVGRPVELAPRAPEQSVTAVEFDDPTDPAELAHRIDGDAFAWTLVDTPTESDVTLGDGPVVHLTPDESGVYRCRLTAPDGDHTVVVRAFPDERRPAAFAVPVADLPTPAHRIDRVSLVGPFNEHRPGRDRPELVDGEYVAETRLLPGVHRYSLLVNDDYEEAYHDELVVPGPGRPRVGLDAEVDSDEVVVTADAERPPTRIGGGAGRSTDSASVAGDDESVSETPLSVEFHLDTRDGLTRENVTVEGETLRIPRSALPGDAESDTADASDAVDEPVRVHAVAVGQRHSVADTVAITADDGGESAADDGSDDRSTDDTDTALPTVHRPNDPPEWGESPTIYEIFVRTFAGGTLDTTFAELERRVPYLDSLHVDAVWLTPVVASPTRHGYHVTDYFDTAADLGSRAEFESFVAACHDHDIQVIFDLVVNHTSRDHPAFQLHSAGVPNYENLYDRVDETPFAPNGATVPSEDRDPDWAGPGAPDFYFNWTRIPNVNYDSLAVRAWMLAVIDEWAAVVDGFRCDVAWGVPHGFWKEVADRLPDDFLLLDETIPADPAYHESEFDVHYDTRLYHTLREIGDGDRPATAVFDALDRVASDGFPRSAVQMRYVENHDETRYLTDCGRSQLAAATAITFTLPGAPMLYAGQERGVPGQRGRMRWHDGDDDLTAFHRACARLRREFPELGTADDESVEQVALSPAPDHLVAFRREVGGRGDAGDSSEDADALVVVCNFDDDPETTTVVDATVGETDLLSGESVVVEGVVQVERAVVLRAV